MASLLETFDGHQSLTLAQISRRSQLPPSSAHRILQRLVELGWVERHGFEYHLGLRMFELGAQVVRRDGIHQAALPYLHALHRSTGLTVHLSALVSADVLHLECVGTQPPAEDSWGLGARQPAVHSAAGRALLAQLDHADWPALSFPRSATPGGVRDRADLEHNLRVVRDRGGVAVDLGSCSAGVTAVAASVGPAEGGLRVALSLCGPSAAVPVENAVRAVRRTARDIWYAAAGVTRRPPYPLLPLAGAAVSA
ncbi:IclR family transcriptional regulator [Actinoplanes sp. NPDC048796]|uniref:IclR family transcriptional regulator n=1 Tax=Actinoplanes sp. NPDC048796 TaxID=3155640 RepID=UPI0033E6DC6E